MKKLKKFAATALAVVLCATSVMHAEPKKAEAAAYCNHVIYYAGTSTDTQPQWCQSYHYKWNPILGWEYVGRMPYCTITHRYKFYKCTKCSYSYSTKTVVGESHGHYVY